jgi:hypothetical protein
LRFRLVPSVLYFETFLQIVILLENLFPESGLQNTERLGQNFLSQNLMIMQNDLTKTLRKHDFSTCQ